MEEKTKITALFENEEDDGMMSIEVTGDMEKIVHGLREAYDALPEFIRDQVQGLTAYDGDTDVDIIELSVGRKIGSTDTE